MSDPSLYVLWFPLSLCLKESVCLSDGPDWDACWAKSSLLDTHRSDHMVLEAT